MDWLAENWLLLGGVLGALIFVLILLARGGKAVFPWGWSIEVPGPKQKVLRERNGSRVFIESTVALSASQELADLKVDRKKAFDATIPRALDYARMKFGSQFYVIQERVLLHLCPGCSEDGHTNALQEAWARLITEVSKSLLNRLVGSDLKKSYVNNGFYEFKVFGPGGDIGDSKDWRDYIHSRQDEIIKFIRHYLRNRYTHTPSIGLILKELERPDSELYSGFAVAVAEVYEKFWQLHHIAKCAQREIDRREAEVIERMRKGEE